MNSDDSRLLLEAVERGAVEDSKAVIALRTYFGQNTDVIWTDALASHELL